MRRMASQITDEQHIDSSFSIGTASNALRKKLNINWIQLNLESNDLACSSTCISQSTPIETDISIPIEANRTVPTEVELFLLICSLFPVDFILPIEDLVIYGMALNLFGDVNDIDEGRCRVQGLIKIINCQLPPRYLNKLCLWEDKYGSQYVKVLCCANDLAKSIASKYQLVLFYKNGRMKSPSTNWYEYSYGLSLRLKRINEHPINLGCPQLALLQLQRGEYSQSIPMDIYEGITEQMVLSLDVPSLIESLKLLCHLRTLRLNILKLEDMSWIGSLMNLELLSISTPSSTNIPTEMGQLGDLRLLDLRKMNIEYIPPGVLSRMLKLEELYLPLSFRRWGCKAQDKHDDYDEWESWETDDYDDQERISASGNQIKRINVSINEITSLSLHALQISIPNSLVLPKKSSIFKNIKRFKVFVPNNLRYKPPGKFYSINELQLTGDAYEIKESGICDLMSRTEDLRLIRVRNLMNVMELQDDGFPKLQKMVISECDKLEYVVDTTTQRILSEDDYLFSNLETLHLSMLSNLKEIWHGRLVSLQGFENLSQISIRFCHKLKYVFPLSILRGSMLLKSIQILDCIEMEGIFYRDMEDDKDLVLYFIEELYLYSLPKLVDFLVHKGDKMFGIHNDTQQSETTNEIASSSMEGSICATDNNFQSFSRNKSTTRVNENCIDDEEVICPPPISMSRGNLQENVSQQHVFNQQVSLATNKDVTGCTEKYGALIPSTLAEKWMQDLKRLEIAFCNALQVIFLFEENHVTTRAFNSLKELKLSGLRNLVHIWFQVPKEIIAFQNLQLLVLSKCRNVYLFSPRVAKLLVQLQKIYVNQCEKMEEIIVEENEELEEEKIEFPRLKLLEFEHIPNLKVFYGGIYAIELPLLEYVKFNQCNKIKYFSYQSSRTPMLKRIQINGSLCSLMGDLNTTLKRYRSFGTAFDDDDLSSTTNIYSPDEQDGSNLLPSTLDELDGSNGPHRILVDDSNELHSTHGELDGSDVEFHETGSSNEQDGSDMLHSTPNELAWLDDIDLLDGTTPMDISTSYANEEANQNNMKEFAFADLKIATNNFSSDALLGEGHFGNVYKGWLDEMTLSPSKTRTGMAVAIKKMKPNTGQGIRERMLEAYFLERLWHPNLVKLLGYCCQDEELLFVYEFMHKGSLDNHLFKRNTTIEPLSWEKRLKIAIGAARGLAFLHTLGKVVHTDVKPSNIMLDDNYNAKISDFGLAGSGPSDGDVIMNDNVKISDFGLTKINPLDWNLPVSTRVLGTFGYMDPLNVGAGFLHPKSDVYSFGVVLLQLMTGSRAVDTKGPRGQQSLVLWSKSMLSEKKSLKNIIDPSMEGEYSSKAMLLTAKLAFKCTEQSHQSRPSMTQVCEALQKIDAINEEEKAH